MKAGQQPPPPPHGEPTLKFLLIGGSGVGKSCLLTRFVDDTFSPSFVSTVGIDFKIRSIVLASGGRVKLQIWDTAGQERFRTITKAFYRGAMCVFLVFDVTDKQSFDSLPLWLDEVTHNGVDDTVPRILIGNKCDLVGKRIVGEAEAKVFASQHGYLYAETSASTGKNVQDVFMNMAERVWAKQHETAQAATEEAQAIDVIRLVDSAPVPPGGMLPQPTVKKGCCQ